MLTGRGARPTYEARGDGRMPEHVLRVASMMSSNSFEALCQRN